LEKGSVFMDEYITAAVAILLIFVALAVVIGRRIRKAKCSACGAKMPRGAQHCPSCGSKVSPDKSHTPAEESPRPSASSVELVAATGPLASQRFSISSQGLSIGRLPDNDIVLAGELTVSRHHAVIALEQGQYVLYDRDKRDLGQ
jgi:ribosomal protein L40E